MRFSFTLKRQLKRDSTIDEQEFLHLKQIFGQSVSFKLYAIYSYFCDV